MTTIKAKLGSILTRSQSSDSVEEQTAENAEAEPEDDSPTNLLHECSECRTVYLSEGSHTCSNCNSMTTAIETAD
jgi:hypothetical protein